MRWSSMKRNLLICLVAFLLGVPCALAQVGTTSLRGTVTDKSGASIGSARVSLDSGSQAFHREEQTNERGEYEFLALPPGSYALLVEKAGFRKFEQRNVQLLVQTPATINITLEVGVVSQTVEVSAQAVTLNTADASLGNAFESASGCGVHE